MANNLRYYREKIGLKQEQLGDLVNTSNVQISRLENGERKLSLEWLERLAPHLNCSPSDLIDDKKPVRPQPAPPAALIKDTVYHVITEYDHFDDQEKASLVTRAYLYLCENPRYTREQVFAFLDGQVEAAYSSNSH